MAFIDGAGVFVNIERLNGEDRKNLPAMCDSLLAAGATGVRNFICYSTTQGAAFGYWSDTSQPPSDARINKTLDAWDYIMSRGLKVVGGATDMNNAGDVTGSGQPMMQAHVENFARLVAARNWPVDQFAAEPVNEWAGWNDNSVTNKFRQAYHGILRAALPKHTLVIAGDYWDYFKNMKGMWTPGQSDTNWLWMVHSYEDHSLADWTTDMKAIAATAAAAGVRAFYGEFGNTNNASALDVAGNLADWQNNFYNASQAAGAAGIIIAPWAVTNGSAERLNVSGGWALRPEVASSIQWANASAYKGMLSSGGATPVSALAPMPTPVPVGTSSGSSSGSGTTTAPITTGGSSSGTSAGSSAGSGSSGATSGSTGTTSGGATGSTSGGSSGTTAATAPAMPKVFSVTASVSAVGVTFLVTKQTGGPNTLRYSLDGQFVGVLRDLLSDCTRKAFTQPAPIAGAHVAKFSLDGSDLTSEVNFTVAPPTSTVPPTTTPITTPVSSTSDIVSALATATADQLGAVRKTLGI